MQWDATSYFHYFSFFLLIIFVDSQTLYMGWDGMRCDTMGCHGMRWDSKRWDAIGSNIVFSLFFIFFSYIFFRLTRKLRTLGGMGWGGVGCGGMGWDWTGRDGMGWDGIDM